MKYFFLNTLGDVDGELAIVDTPPRALGAEYTAIVKGRPVGEELASNVKLDLSKDYRGVKLESLLGNTLSYLIVKAPVKDVIEEQRGRTVIEYIPVTLYNLKKRVHSKDYVIVNPIGVLDCLDLDASEIEYLDEPGDVSHGEVVGVDKFVLDPTKLVKAPSLFRIKEEPTEYVINEALADAFNERGFTNMQLEEIEVGKGKPR